jgi:hypothetical protein
MSRLRWKALSTKVTLNKAKEHLERGEIPHRSQLLAS